MDNHLRRVTSLLQCPRQIPNFGCPPELKAFCANSASEPDSPHMFRIVAALEGPHVEGMLCIQIRVGESLVNFA